jgi:hypothetical protein
MKFYSLDSVFTFGQFEGKTVREVIATQPSYIEFCARELDHFYLNDDVLEAIDSLGAVFTLSSAARERLEAKYEAWECQQMAEQVDYEEDYYERQTYGQYEGSYAQDVEGLSDQFIDDVLDGDPDAYWNID